MKRPLHRIYPDVVNLQQCPQAIQRRLAEILANVWKKIPERDFVAILNSMPDRVQVFIDAMWLYTKYL